MNPLERLEKPGLYALACLGIFLAHEAYSNIRDDVKESKKAAVAVMAQLEANAAAGQAIIARQERLENYVSEHDRRISRLEFSAELN